MPYNSLVLFISRVPEYEVPSGPNLVHPLDGSRMGCCRQNFGSSDSTAWKSAANLSVLPWIPSLLVLSSGTPELSGGSRGGGHVAIIQKTLCNILSSHSVYFLDRAHGKGELVHDQTSL